MYTLNLIALLTAQYEKNKETTGERPLLDVVFIRLTVHSTDAHVLHHLNTTESCNTSSYK